ncbi:ABC transporter permease [Segnochrobactrum spirostomi]|uniref:ABC transporter permease n=1 Tax=Segnochrobactrum spirostomi TaxID=2608987 RepID=A0A6A7XZM9_9HYPH|nr:ABC transporter permease [Segnochrobactrum spirostomi]MQT11371.1 ABC transporter permease [Segnochrobactrum spirostomi]
MARTRGVRRTGLAGPAALVFLALVALAAIAAPFLVSGDPLDLVAPPLVAPFTDPAHPLGSDTLGRDVLSGLVYGARISMSVAAAASVGAIGLGLIVGTLAGFLGGLADDALMRVTEAVQTVPTFLIALALVSVLGPAASSVVIAIALSSWPASARLVRAEVRRVRTLDFVAGCRAIGLSPLRIAFREVLPNALAPVIALAGIVVASAILIESALSFLGLGDANAVSWGGMVAAGRSAIRTAPFLVVIPGIAIALTVLAVTLAADWIAGRLAVERPPA